MAARKKAQTDSSEKPIDGILVQLVPAEKGQAMNIQALGAVSLHELPTLLRLAAKQVEEKLGL